MSDLENGWMRQMLGTARGDRERDCGMCSKKDIREGLRFCLTWILNVESASVHARRNGVWQTNADTAHSQTDTPKHTFTLIKVNKNKKMHSNDYTRSTTY